MTVNKETKPGHTMVYLQDDGKLRVDPRTFINEFEAKRSVNFLASGKVVGPVEVETYYEDGKFVGRGPVTFAFDSNAQYLSCIDYHLTEKRAGRIPCIKDDGTYYSQQEMVEMIEEHDRERAEHEAGCEECQEAQREIDERKAARLAREAVDSKVVAA